VFEAMGQGRPGLVMATVRYAFLTLPACWLGMQGAAALGRPEIYGLVTGLAVVAAISSGVFLVWLRGTLSNGEALPPLPTPTPPAPETS